MVNEWGSKNDRTKQWDICFFQYRQQKKKKRCTLNLDFQPIPKRTHFRKPFLQTLFDGYNKQQSVLDHSPKKKTRIFMFLQLAQTYDPARNRIPGVHSQRSHAENNKVEMQKSHFFAAFFFQKGVSVHNPYFFFPTETRVKSLCKSMSKKTLFFCFDWNDTRR